MAIGQYKARALAAKPVPTFEERLDAFRSRKGKRHTRPPKATTAEPVPSAEPKASPSRCPACGKKVKIGNVYHQGCAYRTNTPGGKKGPTVIARPAIERGIPVPIVDALARSLGLDEALITADGETCRWRMTWTCTRCGQIRGRA